ncbi:bacillithiol system redox-active protein YtxJ [Ochrovirga pacifica]|uniref:bacillithiol system redox-active protein YtxJ n=1 Tax=Ochrovirga pacifica TaxID=1042376 RepID=UPI0002558B26|nr:bacillithiol system redox-active protein YtxJ [Ochrovirga pacifica]
MGLFNKFLGNNKSDASKESSETTWHPLVDVAQLETLIEESKTQEVVIFKHSTRCSISSSVLNRFKNQVGASDTYKLYYLDLIANRDVSNAIAEKFEIVHQSPQAIFLKDGKVKQHDSHYGILELSF